MENKTGQIESKIESERPVLITINSDVRGGVPCVANGRWPITHILEKLAAGMTVEQLSQSYPDLIVADVHLALEAAAWVMRDPAIDWSQSNLEAMVAWQRETQGWQALSDEALNSSELG